MRTILLLLVRWLLTCLRPRLSLQLEVLALRHQLSVYQRTCRRPRIAPADRILWSYLARIWAGWREHLRFVKPDTVLAWQRTRFRDHWRRLSQAGRPGRPPIAKELRELIRRLSRANPTRGSPRIVGELAKLGIDVAKSTVERYRVRPAGPPSPTWKAFLENHLKDLVSIDFFTVPTVRFQVLFVFLVLAHHRGRVVHFNLTANPCSQWTAQQIVEAFPFDTGPRYLLRDRDAIYGAKFRSRVHSLGIEEVRTAPRSPWQNPYVERLIGSIRRECLDHVIVMNERHLKRVLTSYFQHYHSWRVHRSLDMDSPDPRPVQPPELGEVVEFADVGGLQHHYERRAA
jgi:transposase InsO family protein